MQRKMRKNLPRFLFLLLLLLTLTGVATSTKETYAETSPYVSSDSPTIDPNSQFNSWIFGTQGDLTRGIKQKLIRFQKVTLSICTAALVVLIVNLAVFAKDEKHLEYTIKGLKIVIIVIFLIATMPLLLNTAKWISDTLSGY